MKRIFLLKALLLFTLFLSAQNEIPLDSFITTTGVVHRGYLIEDHSPDYFKFKTEQDYILKVPYSSVSSHFFYEPKGVTKNGKEKITVPLSSRGFVSKRNTGIILTSIGIGAMTTGIALMAGYPSDAHTYSNSTGAGVNFTGKGALGFIMALVSPAFIISGSIIWGKASHRIKMNRFQSKQPKDL